MKKARPTTLPASTLIDALYDPADRRDQCMYWMAIVKQSSEHGLLLDPLHVKRLGDLLEAAYGEFDVNAMDG